LPAPGPLAAGAVVAVAALVALELLDDELLPQAARPTTSANAAELLATKVLKLLNLVPLIRLLLFVELPVRRSSGRRLCERRLGRWRRCALWLGEAQAAGRERALQQREQAVDRERERGDADRRPQHA
jgi:hypothetical protein